MKIKSFNGDCLAENQELIVGKCEFYKITKPHISVRLCGPDGWVEAKLG